MDLKLLPACLPPTALRLRFNGVPGRRLRGLPSWTLMVPAVLLLHGCVTRTTDPALSASQPKGAGTQGLLFQVEAARNAPPATSPIEALTLYRDARRDLDSGDQTSAIAKLRRVRQLDPTLLDAANVLAVVLAEVGDLNGALAQLQAVLAVRPDDAVATANLVLVAGRLAERRTKAAALAAANHAAVTPSPASTSAVPASAVSSVNTITPGPDPIARGPEIKGPEVKGPTVKEAEAKAAKSAPKKGLAMPARIEFRNSTMVPGLARRLSKDCAPGLFEERIRVANWTIARLQQSEIQYRPGQEAKAAETAQRLGLSSNALRAHATLSEGVDLRVLIGGDMTLQQASGCKLPASAPEGAPAPASAPSVRS
jgi:tetratricopeptide (TPR) repeat protein